MVDQDTCHIARLGNGDTLIGASVESPGSSMMASAPREAVDLLRRLIGRAVDMLGQGAPQPAGVALDRGDLLLPASPDLRARLRREAAQHGMSLTDWAVVKLGFEGRPPPDELRVVERWRTRC